MQVIGTLCVNYTWTRRQSAQTILACPHAHTHAYCLTVFPRLRLACGTAPLPCLSGLNNCIICRNCFLCSHRQAAERPCPDPPALGGLRLRGRLREAVHRMQLIIEQGDMEYLRDASVQHMQVQTSMQALVLSQPVAPGCREASMRTSSSAHARCPCERPFSSNPPSQVDAADNMDLLRIVQEYEETYESRYDRRPKLTRRLVEEVAGGGGGMRSVPAGSAPPAGAGRAPARMPSPVGDRAGAPAAG